MNATQPTATSNAHSPEPWKANKAVKSSNFGNRVAHVEASVAVDGKPTFYFTVAKVLGGPQDRSEVAEANAARLVACVNACKGINPEAVSDLLTEAHLNATRWDEVAVFAESMGLMSLKVSAELNARNVRAVIAKATDHP